MTDRYQTPDRDDVLFAFHEACPRPTVEEIIDWTSKYPQFADDIRAHAAVARDWDARNDVTSEPPNEILLARAYSRALGALYSAEVEGASAEPTGQSFQEIMAVRGKAVPELAREIGGNVGIARSVLADLVNGGMKGPVGGRFLRSIMGALQIVKDQFDDALGIALSKPYLGQAKATAPPTIIPRTFEDIIRSSGMSEAQIRYWLED